MEKANVTLINWSPNALEETCVAAARCYSDLDNEELQIIYGNRDEKSMEKFISGVISSGHLSTIEHISYTFMIEGVSRAFLAQITRHRLASFSVQSQRYVRLNDKKNWYIIPPEIDCREDCKELFVRQMNSAVDTYNALCDKLIEAGRTEEQAQEDARFVLPNATETKLVVTMNARELLHFFNLRCCNRAQWEIRDVANQMLALVKEVTPELMKKAGPSCAATGKCPEGKRGCGHPVTRDTGATKQE